MNYATLAKLSQQNQKELDEATKIAIANKPATYTVDGCRRWLENDQIVEFTAPSFHGVNGEFSIKNQSGQRIWFSQLSKVAMAKDLRTPMYSTIMLHGESECRISEKFRNASDFWDAVSNKCFTVKVIGTGFIANTDSPKTQQFTAHIVSKLHCNNTSLEQQVFDHVRRSIDNGRGYESDGMIREYKIYALTEI